MGVPRVKLIHLFMGVLLVTTWGMGFVFAKAAIADFPPILLMAFRFSLTALVLIWFVPVPRGQILRIGLVAIVGASLQYAVTFTGLEGLSAGTASLLVQTEMPMAALFAAIFLRDQLGWQRFFGMLVAFAGVVLIVGAPNLQDSRFPMLLVLSGAAMWAAGQVLAKTIKGVTGFQMIAWVALFAAPQLFVLSWIFESDQIALTRAVIESNDWLVYGTVIYLGLVMTAFGYAVFYHLLGLYDVNQVMPFMLLLPVVSILGGMVLLDEQLSLRILVGGAIIITGVAIIMLYRPQGADDVTLEDARELSLAFRNVIDEGQPVEDAIDAAIACYRVRHPRVSGDIASRLVRGLLGKAGVISA